MTAPVRKSWKQFLVMLGAGAVGVVASMPRAVELMRRQLDSLGEVPPAPWVLFLAALLQPLATLRQVERLRAAGAQDYLTKPINVPQFLAAVDAGLALV